MFRTSFAAALLVGGVCCMAQQDDRKCSGPKVEYFEGFGGYDLPLHLQHRVARAQAEALQTYYIAEYDPAGRLAVVRKILNGKTAFRHEYTYDAEGVLTEARIHNSEGVISILRRSPEGRMVKQPQP